MKPSIRLSLQSTAALVGALVIISPIATTKTSAHAQAIVTGVNYSGQNPQSRSTGESDRHRIESERDLELRIFNLRALSELPHPPEKKRPSVKQALAEMQKDFTRL